MNGPTATEAIAQASLLDAPCTRWAQPAAPARLFLANASGGMLEGMEPAACKNAVPADPTFFDRPKYADRLASKGEERE